MKLNMDLCRKILLEAERLDEGVNTDLSIKVAGFEDAQINYHLRALTEGGFLNSHALPDDETEADGFVPYAVTWSLTPLPAVHPVHARHEVVTFGQVLRPNPDVAMGEPVLRFEDAD